MDQVFGDHLKGKVDCIGLHGDYDAGLQLIRDGKLHTLRENLDRGREISTSLGKLDVRSTSSKPAKVPAPIALPNKNDEIDASPSISAQSESLISPGPLSDPLPSAISSTSSSHSDTGSGGTFSPIDPIDDPTFPTRARPLHLVFLGSSIGNFSRESAGPFLRSLPLSQGDTLLLGIDGRPPPGPEGVKKVEIAYNDPQGYTKAFEEHGWDVVKQELGIDNSVGVIFEGRYNEVLGEYDVLERRCIIKGGGH
jgi:hypothetical protein